LKLKVSTSRSKIDKKCSVLKPESINKRETFSNYCTVIDGNLLQLDEHLLVCSIAHA